MLRITWQGHACFRIEGDGHSIVTDPYTPDVAGLAPMRESAEIVIRSSPGDRYHCFDRMVPGEHLLVDALEVARKGPAAIEGIEIEAFEVHERPRGGSHVPAANAMYHFELEGARILHLGDLGHALESNVIERLQDRVDVMFAPTGDLVTVALNDLREVIAGVRPRIVVPMHFQIRQVRFPRPLWVYPVEAFVNGYPEDAVVWHRSAGLSVSRDTLPDAMEVHVLQAAGAEQAQGMPRPQTGTVRSAD
jgi:L-ascorbate metabolism protein UlaG (beta-lactamase superfamily)